MSYCIFYGTKPVYWNEGFEEWVENEPAGPVPSNLLREYPRGVVNVRIDCHSHKTGDATGSIYIDNSDAYIAGGSEDHDELTGRCFTPRPTWDKAIRKFAKDNDVCSEVDVETIGWYVVEWYDD